jgi:alpha-beta hydrolase superfamily lysophospholipase
VVLEAWLVPHPDTRGVVVLFHGHADTKSSLLGHAREFRRLGWSALLVDFYGSGGSAGQETTIGWYEADDVAAAARYASALPGHPRVVLFGTSMGAAAALRAVAVHGLRPQALVLECPFDRLRSTVGHRFSAMGLPSFPAADLLVFWGGVQQGFDALHHDPVVYARDVHAPTLLMNGDRDPFVTEAEAQSIHAALAGPKTLKVFHGLGHESFLGPRRDEWRAAVGAFLEANP